jgi:ParB-like chromosome segregation protein Spo0J
LVIGTARLWRHDALAASIEAIGLLHPVVVSQHGRLLAGQRRLMAFKQLGRETIPVTVIEVQDD